ncbi:cation diffusion facilitator family transporter [Desertivirga xinjiangensis]|uniref:cation diffusion facilitator family transporter n=1 Tax=Desertivirga xinjiangensis TaxID=539206 RepID=UPI00210E7128|nr:cation diffusion facilitator family transporter [Pedobacter xinjiangensis]
MPHNHSSIQSGLTTAFWLNAVFSLIEIAGGLYTNSTAILTDAIHDLGDTVAIGSGVLLEKLSVKKRTKNYSYGYKRFSLLSAFVLSVLLIGGSVIMLIKAVSALSNPHEVNSLGMLWLAVLGIVVNGLAFLKIKNHGNTDHSQHVHVHNHSHHSHSHSQNSQALMLHMLEDGLGWAAVLVGSIIIYFTKWFWIDPLLSIGIALFILFNAIKNLIQTSRIFLQAVPENVNIAQLTKDIMEIKGVKNVHDVHVWTLDGTYSISTVHVVVEKENISNQRELRDKIEKIMDQYSINHPTLQIETSDAPCSLANC